MKTVFFSTILALICLYADGREYKHHLVLKDGVFELYWTVNTTAIPKTVYVNYVAKTTGWSGLGWSKTPNGGQMIQYDVAIGGVRNTNESYLKDYYSYSMRKPQIDPNNLQSLELTSATEAGGFTTVEFNRHADTGDTGNDLPIQNGTKTWIMWATGDSDVTAAGSFSKHSSTSRGYTRDPYDLFSGKKFSDETTKPPTPTTASSAALPIEPVKTILTLAAVLLFRAW